MNDLEQLRDDVRATAPQARPEFAARLERRVEAGFATSPTPRVRRRRINLWAPSAALACTALLAVVVAVATSGSTDDGDEGAGGGGEVAAMQEAAPSPAGDASGGTGGAFSVTPPGEPGRDGDRVVERRDRVVEQQTALELETNADEFTEVTDGVLRIADESGTIVQSSSVSEEEGRGYARFDLRVRASRLDETLAALSRLAHVTSRTASAEDITTAYVSATDRLDDARAERRSLLKALETADSELEAEGIRRQITIARGRIASAKRDVRGLRQRADRAKLAVTVRSTGRRSEGGAWTPGDAVDDAGRILEVAAGVVVVTAAALLPVAILGVLAALAARVVRRRRREAALEAR